MSESLKVESGVYHYSSIEESEQAEWKVVQVEILGVLDDGTYLWQYFNWMYSPERNDSINKSEHYASHNFDGWFKVERKIMSVELKEVTEEIFNEIVAKNSFFSRNKLRDGWESQFFYSESKKTDDGIVGRIDPDKTYFIDPSFVTETKDNEI